VIKVSLWECHNESKCMCTQYLYNHTRSHMGDIMRKYTECMRNYNCMEKKTPPWESDSHLGS
jgi:hypothetical protein